MMTSKQRADLRAKANTLETTLIVGKGGITEAVIAEARILLDSHELVKGKVLETALLSPQEACDALCAATGAEPIQIVGTKFVFYKKSDKEERKKLPSKAKSNPVRQGAQARRKRAKEDRERRNQYFHDAAVQAAIAKRKAQSER